MGSFQHFMYPSVDHKYFKQLELKFANIAPYFILKCKISNFRLIGKSQNWSIQDDVQYLFKFELDEVFLLGSRQLIERD